MFVVVVVVERSTARLPVAFKSVPEPSDGRCNNKISKTMKMEAKDPELARFSAVVVALPSANVHNSFTIRLATASRFPTIW
jgi:hypothetical protein